MIDSLDLRCILICFLSAYLIQRGKGDEAEPMRRELRERTRRVFAPDQLQTPIANNVKGFLLRSRKRNVEGEPDRESETKAAEWKAQR
jgi:hypothetical protein